VPNVYLETSFVSACVSDRTDAKSVYRREASLEWWAQQRDRHALYISAEVIRELSDPTYPRRVAALEWLGAVPLLAITEEVRGLAILLVRERVMPSPPTGDALHVAVASVFAMDYMLSWNVRHLANPNKLQHLRAICLRAGLTPPQILTPDLLWDS
jgi:hypothetical protein